MFSIFYPELGAVNKTYILVRLLGYLPHRKYENAEEASLAKNFAWAPGLNGAEHSSMFTVFVDDNGNEMVQIKKPLLRAIIGVDLKNTPNLSLPWPRTLSRLEAGFKDWEAWNRSLGTRRGSHIYIYKYIYIYIHIFIYIYTYICIYIYKYRLLLQMQKLAGAGDRSEGSAESGDHPMGLGDVAEHCDDDYVATEAGEEAPEKLNTDEGGEKN